MKKRLIIPDECFIVDRLRQRSAVDRGQKNTFQKVMAQVLPSDAFKREERPRTSVGRKEKAERPRAKKMP